MQCERKHKKIAKYETKKPDGSCGGDMVDILSADGARNFGKQCNRCGATLVKCESCGKLYANLARHLVDKDGDETECHEANRTYRTMRAADSMGKGLP